MRVDAYLGPYLKCYYHPITELRTSKYCVTCKDNIYYNGIFCTNCGTKAKEITEATGKKIAEPGLQSKIDAAEPLITKTLNYVWMDIFDENEQSFHVYIPAAPQFNLLSNNRHANPAFIHRRTALEIDLQSAYPSLSKFIAEYTQEMLILHKYYLKVEPCFGLTLTD